MAPRKRQPRLIRSVNPEFENLLGFSAAEAIHDDEFDPEDLVTQAINSDLDSAVFDSLDESDIPRSLS